MPNTETTYFAGGGTITFIPATETANAKLVLDNAEIDIRNSSGAGIFFNSTDDIDIEIKGTNEFSVSYGIVSNGKINISEAVHLRLKVRRLQYCLKEILL